MRTAVIIDAARTPIGKASPETGIFRDVRADDLSAHVVRSLVRRVGIDPRHIEDLRWGCVQQQGEQGINVARIIGLLAELPVETAAATVNRNCASSLQAINDAAHAIMAGGEDVQLVGGVEHMDHVPMTKDYNPNPALFRKHSEAIMQMGLTAEFLAMKHRISRQRQDEFALRSHQLAAKAGGGAFADEIVPTWGRDESGRKLLIAADQGVRPDTSLAALGKLPPAFNPAGGSVTAGNSSQLSVGAAALLMMSESRAHELGLRPMARVLASAAVGVDPAVMGIGPTVAVPKALARAGLKLADIGAIEINEAFAVQVLAVMQRLGIEENFVNTRGGAIALGHPLGASGARIAVTLLHRMRQEGIRHGVATLCVGQGQGVATVFETIL